MKSYELDTHNLYLESGCTKLGWFKKHEHQWHIEKLEENDKTNFSTLNEIKLGQKTQEQPNIKLDKTLDAIQRKRNR